MSAHQRISSGAAPLADAVGVLLDDEELAARPEAQSLRSAHLAERGAVAAERRDQRPTARVLRDGVRRAQRDVQISGITGDTEGTVGGADVSN